MSHESMPHAEAPMVIFRTRKSQWFLLLPVGLTIVAALIFISAFLYGIDDFISNIFIQAGLTLLLVGVFAFAVLVIWIDWYTTFYVLTDNTIEKTSGFITRTTTHLSLHDLSRVDCQTGIAGGLLGFGRVIVESETTEKPLILVGVPDPDKVIQLIRQARAHVAGSDK